MTLRPLLLIVLCAAGTLSCALLDATGGGGLGSSAQCGQEQTGVTGTREIIGITGKGEHRKPADLSQDLFEAYVPLPSGGYTVMPGTGSADGTFEIPGVPPGAYLLRWNSTWFATECHTLDLSGRYYGDPEGMVLTPGSQIGIEASGMAPWSDGDDLQFVSASAGMVEYGVQSLLSPPLAPGSAGISGKLDYGSLAVPWTINADEGAEDDFAVGHVSAVFEGAPQMWALTHVLVPQEFSIPGSQLISGSFEPVNRSTELKIKLRRGEFARQVSAGAPGAVHLGDNLYVAALIGGTANGNFDTSADLLAAKFPPAFADETYTFKYGNPYPGLSPFAQVASRFEVRLPVGSSTVTAPGFVYVEDVAERFAGAEIEPLVGPVSNPTVDSRPFGEPGSISPAPTLSWSEPADGKATAYALLIYRLDESAQPVLHAILYTEETSVQLPDAILAAGDRYYFRLRAEHAPRRQRVFRPYLHQFPSAGADAISAVFTVGTPGGGGGGGGGTPTLPTLIQSSVGFWELDEGGGSQLMDASGRGSTGSLSGAFEWMGGWNGAALRFAGGGVHFGSLAPVLSRPYTFSAWVRSEGGDSFVLGREPCGVPGVSLRLFFGTPALVHGTLATVSAPSALPPGAWAHVAGTWDGSHARLYVNGSEVMNQFANAGVGDNGGALTAGLQEGGCGAGQPVSVDRMAVFERALTAAEISTLMQSQ